MRVNIKSKNNGIKLAIFLVKLFLVISMALGTMGFFILKSVGSEYIAVRDLQKRCTEKVTATVVSVDKRGDDETVKGYQTLSYQYNGEDYVTEMECYTGSHMHYSSDGSSEVQDAPDLEERLDESWEKIQQTVGTEQEVMIDPDAPEVATIRLEKEDLKPLRMMILLGLAPFVLIGIFVVLLIVLLVKKGKAVAAALKENSF